MTAAGCSSTPPRTIAAAGARCVSAATAPRCAPSGSGKLRERADRRMAALIPDRVERCSHDQLIRRLWRPGDLRRDAEQPVVVIVVAIEVEPEDRLRERLDLREGEQPRAAERLDADAARELPVIVALIIGADIADDIAIDRGERRVDRNSCVLHTCE